MILLRIAEKADPTLSVCLGFVLIAAIGLLDYLTGCELSFSLFYFLPLGLVAWKGRRWLGIIAAFVCAAAWFAVNGAAGKALANPFAIYWNVSARLLSLVLFSILVFLLREWIARLHELSQSDPLLGLRTHAHSSSF